MRKLERIIIVNEEDENFEFVKQIYSENNNLEGIHQIIIIKYENNNKSNNENESNDKNEILINKYLENKNTNYNRQNKEKNKEYYKHTNEIYKDKSDLNYKPKNMEIIDTMDAEKRRLRARERYANDPEHREKMKKKRRDFYYKQKFINFN